MTHEVIGHDAIDRRLHWIAEIVRISGNFGSDSTRVEAELNDEIRANGAQALLDHLRLCSAIPESYGHDSSEEKLYSKYTDALISSAYTYIGLRSVVLTERADAADVEAVGEGYSFVADAKVFRLSRTAKNQKDFKIQAMDGWRRGKPYAMVICPLYQLPTRSSQIYQQSSARNVCIFTYSHLSVLVQVAENLGVEAAMALLLEIFKSVESMNPSKDAGTYWSSVNRVILEFHDTIGELWRSEKVATIESIAISKEIALNYLARERELLMRLTREEAVARLIEMHKIDSRAAQIASVTENNIMNLR